MAHRFLAAAILFLAAACSESPHKKNTLDASTAFELLNKGLVDEVSEVGSWFALRTSSDETYFVHRDSIGGMNELVIRCRKCSELPRVFIGPLYEIGFVRVYAFDDFKWIE